MKNSMVLLYGASTNKGREDALDSLPFYANAFMHYAEHGPNGMPLNSKDSNRAIAARRRNETMAMLCVAVVIIGRPKYAQAVVRSFRNRGRRVYWYTNGRMMDTEQMRDYTSIDRAKLPKTSTWEPDMWEAQRAEKMKAIDEYLYQHPESLRTPDSIPTFGWQEVFNARDFDIPETDALHWSHHGGSLAEK